MIRTGSKKKRKYLQKEREKERRWRRWKRRRRWKRWTTKRGERKGRTVGKFLAAEWEWAVGGPSVEAEFLLTHHLHKRPVGVLLMQRHTLHGQAEEKVHKGALTTADGAWFVLI
jgi:hypothetical protein